ncbi:uncharacterized protein ARMOST_10449 [Armillaria ostoyae]|uniref:Uncharacterized protein n=1 Tax=Armillaria ostoyae TaxID=47428 RepID=A0A284RED0_ARMOS|nr:uncharacterized protein ARMOST_10449 [Armillaria ostoyae]
MADYSCEHEGVASCSSPALVQFLDQLLRVYAQYFGPSQEISIENTPLV